MTKINENNSGLGWIYKIGFFIILALPILVWPPYFFPADWGKNIIFRSVVAIMLFLFIWQTLYKKIKLPVATINRSKTVWALRALLFVYLLAGIFSVDPNFSFWGSPYRGGGLVNFMFYFAIIAMSFVMFREKDWDKVWIFSIIIGVLVSLLGIIQYYGLFNKIFLSVPSSPPSTMGNPDILAFYLLLLSFLTLAFAIKENIIWRKIFYWASLAIFLFTILITGCRAAYLGLAVGALYFLFTYSKKIDFIKIAGVSLLVLMAGIVIYVNTATQFPKFLQDNRIFSYVASRLSIKTFLNDPRFDAWQIGLKAIESKPLLGYGMENFAVGFDKYYNPAIPNLAGDAGWYDRAHDIILQTGSDAGVLGIIAYLALFIILFWQLQTHSTRLARSGQENDTQIIIHGIQATLIGYFCANLFGFDTFSTYLIFFLLVAYSLHLILPENPKSEIRNPKQIQNSKYIITKKCAVIFAFIILLIFLWQYNFVPLQINAQINNAQIFVDQKKCDQAFKVLDKVLLKHSFLDSYIRLQYVQFERTCAVSYPENNLAYTKKGIELLNEAVKVQPLYTRYWLFLGNLTTTLAEQEADQTLKNKLLLQADSYLNTALQLSPKHQEILAVKIKILIDAKNYEDAQNEAKKCIALNADFPDCYFYLGLTDIYLKNTTDADKNIQTAVAEGYNINLEQSLVDMANVYNSLSDYKNLVLVFEKLVVINPNAVQYHSSLAVVYKELGKYSKARQEANKVLQLSPASKQNVDAFLSTLP